MSCYGKTPSQSHKNCLTRAFKNSCLRPKSQPKVPSLQSYSGNDGCLFYIPSFPPRAYKVLSHHLRYIWLNFSTNWWEIDQAQNVPKYLEIPWGFRWKSLRMFIARVEVMSLHFLGPEGISRVYSGSEISSILWKPFWQKSNPFPFCDVEARGLENVRRAGEENMCWSLCHVL